MSSSLLETLLLSSKIEPSEDYDATYETIPVVIAESTKDLDAAFAKPGSMFTSICLNLATRSEVKEFQKSILPTWPLTTASK